MIRYDETCKVTCVDNNETVSADILEFKPQVLLSVSLNKTIKMVLKYAPVNPALFIDPETVPLLSPPKSMATAQATGAVRSIKAIPIANPMIANMLSVTKEALIIQIPDTNKPTIGTILRPHFFPHFKQALSLNHPPVKQPNAANK